MPSLVDEHTPAIRVAPSAVLELMWVLHMSQAGHEHGGAFATLDPLRSRFGQKITELMSDGLAQNSAELVVLGHRSGTLLDLDLQRFFERFNAAVTERSGGPTLLSETPADREIVRARLERLRADTAFCRRYVELMSAVWDAVAPEWESVGRAAVVAEAQRWTRELQDQGAGYKSVLGLKRLWPGRPELDDMADIAAAEGKLILNPCWFGGKIHMIELDGTVVAGRGMRHGSRSYRKVADEVAASIKAIADPTRLTILLRLAREPASVTELARQLKLSQPTVSAHVEVLREAGLIEERVVGRSTELSASEESLRRLFSRTEESLVRLFRS
jgi:DNA-binding transcriptional ArsR family regulator